MYNFARAHVIVCRREVVIEPVELSHADSIEERPSGIACIPGSATFGGGAAEVFLHVSGSVFQARVFIMQSGNNYGYVRGQYRPLLHFVRVPLGLVKEAQISNTLCLWLSLSVGIFWSSWG
jgi:hypothetical protein